MALSEFYLDVELSDEDLQRIKRVLDDNGYTLEEARMIERDDVRPVVGSNLRGPAGEWSGFDGEWLFTAIIARMERKWRWPRLDFLSDGMTRRYWDHLGGPDRGTHRRSG